MTLVFVPIPNNNTHLDVVYPESGEQSSLVTSGLGDGGQDGVLELFLVPVHKSEIAP